MTILAGVFLVIFMLRINKITRSIDELTQTINNTVHDTGESIRGATGSIEKFIKSLFTVEVVRKSIVEIFKAIKERKEKQNEK